MEEQLFSPRNAYILRKSGNNDGSLPQGRDE